MAGYESQKDYEESVGSGPHKHRADEKGYCKFCGKDMASHARKAVKKVQKAVDRYREKKKEEFTTPRKLMKKAGIPVIDK